MKLSEFLKTIVPQARKAVENPNDAEAVLQKAAVMIGDQPLTDDKGNPVDIESISLSVASPDDNPSQTDPASEGDPNVAKGADEPDGDEPKDSDTKKWIEAAVKAAVAEATKALAPRRTKAFAIPYHTPAAGSGGEFRIPAEAKRFGSLKNFKRPEVGGLTADARAYRFGVFCMAAMGNLNCQKKLAQWGMELKLQQSNINSAGGYLVPEEFGQDLIDLRERFGTFRKYAKNVPMSSDTRTDPRRAGGLTAYFVGEGAAGTEDSKKWDQVRLTAKDLMIIARYTNQIDQDAAINIGDDLAGEISYSFAVKEDSCGWLGDGTSTYGGITGVGQRLLDVWTNYSSADTAGTVKQGSSTGWSNLALTDFHKMVGKLPQFADNGDAAWYCHRAFFYSVMQKLMIASGGVTSLEVRDGTPTLEFLGYPVRFSQVFPGATVATTTGATMPVVFGNLAMAASFGDRRQDQIAFSDSATIGGQSVFERAEIAIRGIERFDINVHDVGWVGGLAGYTSSDLPGPVIGLIVG